MWVGIDEAGRGPLAGPVVSCALYLLKKIPFKVKDSKKLSCDEREEIFYWLKNNSHWGVGLATNEEIDKFNILNATFLSFERAINNLLVKNKFLKKATFIIDGNVFKTNLEIKYKCIEKADEKIKVVACASIVAKVFRDYLMSIIDFLYPKWNFSKHKGYPTREHFELIKHFNLTPFHRQSFFPCNGKE